MIWPVWRFFGRVACIFNWHTPCLYSYVTRRDPTGINYWHLCDRCHTEYFWKRENFFRRRPKQNEKNRNKRKRKQRRDQL